MNFSMDGELSVLPSRVISLCLTDTAFRQAYYHTANILFWVGRWWVDGQAAERWMSFLVRGRLNGWVYVARAQGIVAILFNECQYEQ